jgi:hypothetical protein
MPQASDNLRAKMKEYFGDEVSDAGPMKYLESRDIQINKGFVYHIPADKPITSKDLNCLNFMVDEWDYDYKWEGVTR